MHPLVHRSSVHPLPATPAPQVGQLLSPFCIDFYELGPLQRPKVSVGSPFWPRPETHAPPRPWPAISQGRRCPLPPTPGPRALGAGELSCFPGEPGARGVPGTPGLPEGVKTTAHLGPSVSRVTAGGGEGCSHLQELRFHTCAPSICTSHILIPVPLLRPSVF